VRVSFAGTHARRSVLIVFAGPKKGSRQMNGLPDCDQNWRCRISGENASSTTFAAPPAGLGIANRARPETGATTPKSNSRASPSWSGVKPATSPRTAALSSGAT
jgi:hypothetical protein